MPDEVAQCVSRRNNSKHNSAICFTVCVPHIFERPVGVATRGDNISSGRSPSHTSAFTDSFFVEHFPLCESVGHCGQVCLCTGTNAALIKWRQTDRSQVVNQQLCFDA